MKNNIVINKQPSIVLTKDKDICDRIDASYYHFKYFENMKLIQKNNTIKLKEICNVFRGVTPKADNYSKNNLYYIIKSDNLTSAGIKYGEIPCISEEFFTNNMKKRIQKDTILISSIGSGSTGKADILSREGLYLTVSENTIVEKKVILLIFII